MPFLSLNKPDKGITGFATLLRSSVQFYSSHVVSLLLINLLVIVPVVLLAFGVATLYPVGAGAITPDKILMARTLFLILALMVVLFSFLSGGALIIFIVKNMRRENVPIMAAYRLALGKFPDYMKINAICGLKVLGWGLLLILPGIYFSVLYSFAPLLVLIEGKNSKEAMALSAALLKPNLIKYLDYLLYAAVTSILSYLPFLALFEYLVEFCVGRGNWQLADSVSYLELIVVLMAVQFNVVFYIRLFEEIRPLRP